MQLSSSITTMPPEPMIEPSLPSFRSRRRVEHLVRNASAGRAAGLHRLDRVAAHAAFADVVDEVDSGVPSGISTRPVFWTLPTSENTLVPGALRLPVSVNQPAALVTIGATLYQVSTLLMLVG
jgi:hypothetical protein